MLVTNHVLAGATIGRLLHRRPAAAFAAGVVSHFAMDRIPHWGGTHHADFLRVAVVDGLIGLAAMGGARRASSAASRPAVLAAMVGAALPDLNKPSQLFFGRSCFPSFVDHFHGSLQVGRESTSRMPQELAVAAGLAALALGVAVVSRRRAARAAEAAAQVAYEHPAGEHRGAGIEAAP